MVKNVTVKTAGDKSLVPREWPEFLDPDAAQIITNMCLLGATEAQIAAYFDVPYKTFQSWLQSYTGIVKCLRQGRELADAQVTASLFKRAVGYECDDEHISNYQGDITITPIKKRFPPDPTACIFWLKNRRPDLWRDKVDVEHSGKIETKEVLDLTNMTQEQRDLLRQVLVGTDIEEKGSPSE